MVLLTEKLSACHIADMRELRQQLQKSTIIVGILQGTHLHPWLARIGCRYKWLEFGWTAMKVKLLQHLWIVQIRLLLQVD